jgi:hypothetical protein
VGANRRQQTRYDVSISAMLKIGDEVLERFITNLSLGGCLIAHDQRLPLGMPVELTFRIPTKDEPLLVKGATRWSSDSGSGIQFEGLRARDVWLLNKYFEVLQKDLAD